MVSLDTEKGATMSNSEPILLVSIREAARMISVSQRTIFNLIAAKRLPMRRIGRRSLVPRSALEQLARRDVPSPTIEAAKARKATVL
jgi:excisionase family DNA binding protein